MESNLNKKSLLEKGIELDRIALNKDNIKSDLHSVTCKFCQLVPLKAEICLRCQQIFCNSCINNYIEKENNKCPNCLQPYQKGSPNKDQEKIFNNMQINCVYFSLGCDEVLEYKNVIKHAGECKDKFKECENCNEKFRYVDFNDHVANCQMSLIKCMQCSYKETQKNYEKTEHLINHIQHRLIDSVQNYFKEELNNMKKELKEYLDQKMTSSTKSNTEEELSKLNKIKFCKDICNNADNNFQVENKFVVFQTYLSQNLLVWGNQSYEIEIYDLEEEKTSHVIKKAHDSNILSLSHCQNTASKMSYVLSSSFDRSLKVWSVEENWKNIVHIPDAHIDYSIFSSLLIYNHLDNKSFIISSNFKEKVFKIWDFEGRCLNTVNDKGVRFITYWFEKESRKYFLIVCNDSELNSYEFVAGDNCSLYKYYSNDHSVSFTSALVNTRGQIVASDISGKIHMWNLHTSEPIKTIARGSNSIRISAVSLWDDNYLLAASNDKFILLFDLNEGTLLKSYKDHSSEVFCVKVFNHPQIGKCFFSYGFDSKIKLWK